jgi:hypothetical protein
MTAGVVPEEITHLDFEPGTEATPSLPCEGWQAKRGSLVIGGNGYACDKPAVLRARYACCGMISHYCLDCYNNTCRFAAGHERVLHSGHWAKEPLYAEVTFL